MPNYTAVIISFEKHQVLDKISRPKGDMISFKISANESSLFSFMQSLSASPSRYIEEALRRSLNLCISNPIVLFNPIAKLDEPTCHRIFSALDEGASSTEITIWCDLSGFPIAFGFPTSVLADLSPSYKLGRYLDLFFLRFLSATNVELDRLILSLLFDRKVLIKGFPYSVTFNHESGFIYESCQVIPGPVASHCIGVLTKLVQDKKNSSETTFYELLKANTDIKKIIVHPYHAGDVLFASKAIQDTTNPFDTLMLCEDYSDIASEAFPQLHQIKIPRPTFGRDANKIGDPDHGNFEHLYFEEVLRPAVPEGSLFYYCRPFRNYSHAHFHLLDQLKFAVASEPNWTRVDQQTVSSFKPKGEERRKRVLLQFDAGWSLKIYPEKFQDQLIEELHKLGFEVSILSEKSHLSRVRTYSFKNLSQLKNLILDQAILIAMDSFPAHFAAQILNHPTICLFGSTRPSNSNYIKSAFYDDLSNKMECSPCSGMEACPRFQLSYCSNFASPIKVAERAKQMYLDCYGAFYL